jgi:hypothetical protein
MSPGIIMIDLLFIKFGAAVTGVLSRTKCTVEPWCDPHNLPYGVHGSVEVDFARALSRASVLRDRGSLSVEPPALRAWFDPGPDEQKLPVHPVHGFGGTPIGPSFPGCEYEGVVSILEDDVNANATLKEAVATFPGHRWEYQVVVSVDEASGVARHYHGFHAEILKDEGDTLVLLVANARMSALPDWAATARTVPYDPRKTETFYTGARVAENLEMSYTGARVAENLVAGGPSRRRSGAVYMTAEAAASFGIDVPKLPPGLGSSTPELPANPGEEVRQRPPGARPATPLATPMIMDPERTVTAIQPASDSFLQVLTDEMECETVFPTASGNDVSSIEMQRKKQVQALFDGAEFVDLVGHSTPIKCYLKLGDWVLDPREAERLASFMPRSVKRVRLIGCATAKTDDGCAAAKALAGSGRLAYGTINNVYTTHFDKNGVKRGIGAPALRAFLPSKSLADPSPPTVDVSSPPVCWRHTPGVAAAPDARGTVPRFLAWLGRHAWLVISAPFAVLVWLVRRLFATPDVPHRWIWWLLGPLSAEMPGLLTEPLLTYEIRAGREIWTLEILFNFERARFYSRTDSDAKKQRVYKVRCSAREAKSMLEAYLPGTTLRGAAVRAQVLLRRRHDEAGSRGGVLEPAPIEMQTPEETGNSSRSESLSSTG